MVLGLALLIFIAYEARVAAVSAGHKGGLNPYSDGRTLSTNGDKFKIVLFSDLHYGERGTNNSWVKWADEAVRISPRPNFHHSILPLLRRIRTDSRTPRAPR